MRKGSRLFFPLFLQVWCGTCVNALLGDRTLRSEFFAWHLAQSHTELAARQSYICFQSRKIIVAGESRSVCVAFEFQFRKLSSLSHTIYAYKLFLVFFYSHHPLNLSCTSETSEEIPKRDFDISFPPQLQNRKWFPFSSCGSVSPIKIKNWREGGTEETKCHLFCVAWQDREEL